jgi:hypothetical protein
LRLLLANIGEMNPRYPTRDSIVEGPAETPNRDHARFGLRVVFLALLLALEFSSAAAVPVNNPPILVSQATSTRAIAVESLTLTTEPFALVSPFGRAGQRTRVMVFALNLNLQSGEDLSAVSADAEDAAHRHYNLAVESIRPVPSYEWLSAVVLKLNDDLGDVGDVLVGVSYQGMPSNRVRIAIGHLGGGPADDPGATPTLAPPYSIGGQITDHTGQPLGGITINLTGAETKSASTGSDGRYSLTVNKVGDYTLTPVTTPYHTFVPQAIQYLHQNQIANFNGTLRYYQVKGRLSLASIPTGGVSITVTGSQTLQTTTNANGDYSFDLPAGGNYTITPSLAFYDFLPAPFVFNDLTADQLERNFNGTLQTHSIGGRLTNDSGAGLPGITVNLTGATQAMTTTDANGNYQFTGLLADYDFTVTPVTNPYYTFTSQMFNHLTANQNANFAGTLRYYTVRGYVHLGPNNAPNFPLQLTGSQTTTVNTDANGDYAISLPAGGTYAFTPSLTYYSFVPASRVVTDLTSDQTNKDFVGARQAFTISGEVRNLAGSALEGIMVTLTGAPELRTSVSDNAGHYQFTNLDAGYDYTAAPASNALYLLTPHDFIDLRNDQAFDFVALRRLVLQGIVRDNSGNGLIGVRVTSSGTDNSYTVTAADGSYSLPATETGTDTVTPSVGQDWYSFAPGSIQFSNLLSSQFINFTATLAAVPNPQDVLKFDGDPKTVDYGNFWPEHTDLGHFYWEFWATPGPNAGATYVLSDGYGGAHALLFGVGSFNTSEPDRYELLGNLFDGVRFDNYFGSDVGPAIGEWAHLAVGWDGHNIITYYNGVPVGKTPFNGPRRSPGPGGGGGRLLIGGSDHSNFDGRIAQVRGFEDANPREGSPGGVESAFAPQTVFGLGGNLLSYYFRPGTRVADLSGGYNGSSHEGIPRGTTAGILWDCGACPPPQFIVDPSAPNFTTGVPPQPVNLPTPANPPAQALVFDSFSRPNSTYIFGGNGGLGSTESGSTGPQLWQTNQNAGTPQPFGVLNARAVLLGSSTAVAWVPTGSTDGNVDVRVDRYKGRWGSGIHSGVSFRVVNAANFFFAYTADSASDPQNKILDVGYYQDGNRLDLASDLSIPSQWTTLRVVTLSSGDLAVYIDGTLVYHENKPMLASATGAGLFNDSAGKGLINRWDNFTVFEASQQTVAGTLLAKRSTHNLRNH